MSFFCCDIDVPKKKFVYSTTVPNMLSLQRTLGRCFTGVRSPLSSAVRGFSGSAVRLSNIGKLPLMLSDDVSCVVEEIPSEFCKKFTKGKHTYVLNRQVVIKGEKGTLKTAVPQFVQITKDASGKKITVKVDDPTDKIQRSMWGTTRALLQNNLLGATEGYLAIVKFVGTGYRAIIEKLPAGADIVQLKIGLPYSPRIPVPKGITVSSPNATRLLVEGPDKQQVHLFAALIRSYKKPEPYKGKGIFVNDETIKLKEKKIK